MKILFVYLTIFIGAMFIGCSEDYTTESTGGNLIRQYGTNDTPGDFGKTTSIVIYINPEVNEGTTPKIEMGTEKTGITVKLEDKNPVYTDASGVAVLKNVPVRSNLPISINNSIVYVNVLAQLDQYDVIIKYKDDTAEIVTEPVRHEFVENIKIADTIYTLSDQLSENNLIILLNTRVYAGDVEIIGNNLCIMGAGIGSNSVIDGNVTVYGNNVCITDVAVTGNLIVKRNNFQISYSEFNGIDIEREDVVILKNRITTTNIMTDKVYLFDNVNLD